MSQSLELNLGIVMWDGGVLTSRLNAYSVYYMYIILITHAFLAKYFPKMYSGFIPALVLLLEFSLRYKS